MARKARRTTIAPRLEALEGRALLSRGVGPVSVAWAAGDAAASTGTVFVRFAPGTPADRAQADLAAVGGRVAATFPDGPDLVALPAGSDQGAAIRALRADPGVVYAEADVGFHAAGAFVPNDPQYYQEWGMAQIDAPQAWGLTTGTPATVVAVIDSGIDLYNPDFAGKIWVNPNPYGDVGRCGDVNGWNFVSNTANVQDNNGHGTHVAGILAAAGNNGAGIAGVDWDARIMPLKVLDAQGNGDSDRAVTAIYFAVQHGAKVINASWGGDVYSQAMLDALNYANSLGVVFVTAAGNDHSNNDAATTFPASYRTPNELVVAAVDRAGNLADFSNYGPSTVDLAAPGVDITSAVPGGFQTYSGTSMSTPFVAGTVALLAGLHPEFSAAQLVAQVRATVKPVPALNGLLISPGVVDPYFALLNHRASPGGHVAATSAPTLVPGATSFEDLEAAILTDDHVYALDGGTPAGYVQNLYQALFGRAPSPDELGYYSSALAGGATRADVVRRLQNAPESLRARVARWYRDELGSTLSVDALKSDPGVIYYSGLLAAGRSDADVQAALFSNDQLYAAVGGTPAAFVGLEYHAMLGRDADPAGLSYFLTGLAAGVSRGDITRDFLAAPEGHQTTVARLFVYELGWGSSLASLKANPGVGFWAGFLGGD